MVAGMYSRIAAVTVVLPFVFANLSFGCYFRRVAETTQESTTLSTRRGVDWPCFLGPERNGHSRETGLNLDWNNRPPRVVWTRQTGEGYGAGVVAAGRYFHFDRDQDDARLVCLNAETGNEIWEFRYPTDYTDLYGFDGGPRASPLVDGDRVYIFGAEGMLHCIDIRSGQVKWKIDTANRFSVVQNFFGTGSSPLVFDDLLIAVVGGSPPESKQIPPGHLDRVAPDGCGIVAFDKLTGEVRYQTIDDLASYASPVVTAIEGKPTGFAFLRSGLFAFDPVDGTELWAFPWRSRKFESVNASTPVVTDSGILITESYGPGGALVPLMPVKPDSRSVPEPVWHDSDRREKSLACHWNTPVVVGGMIYASSGEKKSTAALRCVRLADGQVIWSEPGLSRSSLIAVDQHLVCLTETGRLFSMLPDRGQFNIVGQLDPAVIRLVEPCWSAPILSHGLLYVHDAAKIVCLDIQE